LFYFFFRIAKKSLSHDDVDILALHLFDAIMELNYKEIEQLVATGRDEGLLDVKDKENSTFLHLVADLIWRRLDNIQVIDDSSPFCLKKVNIE
jgi:hypothetical protein